MTTNNEATTTKSVLPLADDLQKNVAQINETKNTMPSETQHLTLMASAYEEFLKKAMPEDLYKKVDEAAKRGNKRIDLLTFSLQSRVFGHISFCSLLQGTHKTELPNALNSFWVKEFKKCTQFKPVLDELRKRLDILDNPKYTLRCYKYSGNMWAVELEWYPDEEHMKKLEIYKEKFGNPW
jgi:hypothetical protein